MDGDGKKEKRGEKEEKMDGKLRGREKSRYHIGFGHTVLGNHTETPWGLGGSCHK